jgi:hypothetical protein
VRRAGSELAGWWVCAVAADRVLAPLELHLNTTAAVRQTVLQHKAHVRYGPTRVPQRTGCCQMSTVLRREQSPAGSTRVHAPAPQKEGWFAAVHCH